MKEIKLGLTGLSLSLLILSLNRLTRLTTGFISRYEFLRWQDFHAMLTIPLVIILLYILLFWQTVQRNQFMLKKKFVYLLATLMTGVYLYGASSGLHEGMNYLNQRFCLETAPSQICTIIAFNDDMFSHYLFYAALIIITLSLLAAEFLNPSKEKMSRKDMIIVGANAFLIGAGLTVNLGFEQIGVDLYAVFLMMLLSLVFLWQKKSLWRQMPIIFYSSLAYSLGTVGALMAQWLR